HLRRRFPARGPRPRRNRPGTSEYDWPADDEQWRVRRAAPHSLRPRGPLPWPLPADFLPSTCVHRHQQPTPRPTPGPRATPACPSRRGDAVTEDRASQVQRVKAANDIVDVVGAYVALRPVGPTFKGLCPFHDDHRPSFDVDPRRQRYRCWACNKHGDVILFIQEMERVDFREALELLARRAGISLEKFSRNPHQGERAAMLDVTRWCAQQYHQCLLDSPLAEEARLYVGQRGLKG